MWLLESYRRQGLAESKILASYPTLRAADLVHAWSYVDAHRVEIEPAAGTADTDIPWVRRPPDPFRLRGELASCRAGGSPLPAGYPALGLQSRR